MTAKLTLGSSHWNSIEGLCCYKDNGARITVYVRMDCAEQRMWTYCYQLQHILWKYISTIYVIFLSVWHFTLCATIISFISFDVDIKTRFRLYIHIRRPIEFYKWTIEWLCRFDVLFWVFKHSCTWWVTWISWSHWKMITNDHSSIAWEQDGSSCQYSLEPNPC